MSQVVWIFCHQSQVKSELDIAGFLTHVRNLKRNLQEYISNSTVERLILRDKIVALTQAFSAVSEEDVAPNVYRKLESQCENAKEKAMKRFNRLEKANLTVEDLVQEKDLSDDDRDPEDEETEMTDDQIEQEAIESLNQDTQDIQVQQLAILALQQELKLLMEKNKAVSVMQNVGKQISGETKAGNKRQSETTEQDEAKKKKGKTTKKDKESEKTESKGKQKAKPGKKR